MVRPIAARAAVVRSVIARPTRTPESSPRQPRVVVVALDVGARVRAQARPLRGEARAASVIAAARAAGSSGATVSPQSASRTGVDWRRRRRGDRATGGHVVVELVRRDPEAVQRAAAIPDVARIERRERRGNVGLGDRAGERRRCGRPAASARRRWLLGPVADDDEPAPRRDRADARRRSTSRARSPCPASRRTRP